MAHARRKNLVEALQSDKLRSGMLKIYAVVHHRGAGTQQINYHSANPVASATGCAAPEHLGK